MYCPRVLGCIEVRSRDVLYEGLGIYCIEGWGYMVYGFGDVCVGVGMCCTRCRACIGCSSKVVRRCQGRPKLLFWEGGNEKTGGSEIHCSIMPKGEVVSKVGGIW